MKKRGVGLIVFFGLIFVFFLSSSYAVETNLDIENSPPYLVKNIPNQSWAGGNLSEAFDLDDYFESAIVSTLDYSSSDVEDIGVFINKTNNSNKVSFYADASFSGEREVIFYASDGNLNASSNIVYLFVGMDDMPPKWSFMEKDKEIIYQSDYVQFKTNWTDDFGLYNYTLSVNQGSGFLKYNGGFSGLANASIESVQISAPAGQTISWFFCAYDTSANINCTDIRTFVVSSRTIPPSGPSYSDSDDERRTSTPTTPAETEQEEIKDFSLSATSFLVSVKPGFTQTKILEIKNTGNTALNFTLSLNAINNLAVLSESELFLYPGETKKIVIDFSPNKDTIPGQYFGEIYINSSYSAVTIPVVINVNPLETDAEVSVDIYNNSKFVKPGKNVTAKITLKNLKDAIKGNVTLYLSIKDYSGNVIDFSEESLALSSVVSLNRSFFIPEDLPLGDYLFHARLSKGDKILSLDSDVFEVGVRFRFLAFLKSSFIFLLIFFLSIFSILLILRYKSLERSKKTLSLYIEALELKKLMAKGDFESAVGLFIKMKKLYGEPVSKELLKDKELLKVQMKNLADKFDLGKTPVVKKSEEDSKQDKDKKTSDPSKETKENKTEESGNKEESGKEEKKEAGKKTGEEKKPEESKESGTAEASKEKEGEKTGDEKK